MSEALYIVECRLPSGKVFKRSKPMSAADAKEQVRELKGMKTFTAHVVPAEKYAVTGRSEKVERPEDATPKGGFRSKVD